MPTHTSFKAASEIGIPQLSDSLETNLVEFFNWAFLNIGGFFTVTIPSSGAYGGNEHVLRPVRDNYYSNGRVWQSFRKNWVWEDSLDYGIQPISISGIFVDNEYFPASGGTYNIDYINGRIIFNTGISTNSTVTCEYSYKYYNITNNKYDILRRIQFNSFRVDNREFSLFGSGDWDVNPNIRQQLPLINIRVSPSKRFEGKEIGGLSAWIYQDVEIDIAAESDWDFKQACDFITNDTYQKTIRLFNKQSILENSDYPLQYDGTLNPAAKTYPELVAETGVGGHFWKKLVFNNFYVKDYSPNLPLYSCKIIANVKTDHP